MTDPTSEAAPTRGKGLLCPVCRVVLLMADRQGIEIDYCPQCRGVWLDRGELDKIVDRSAAHEHGPGPPLVAAPPSYDHGPGEGHFRRDHGGSADGEGHQGSGHGGNRLYRGGHDDDRQRGFLSGLFDRH